MDLDSWFKMIDDVMGKEELDEFMEVEKQEFKSIHELTKYYLNFGKLENILLENI